MFAVLVLVALGGLIVWKKSGEVDLQKLITMADLEEGEIPDHFRGNLDAKVIVIQYADFACVHCAQMSSTYDKIFADYEDRVLFIYRNFSLKYPSSTITQSAAEAVYLLGGEAAYWQMHDLLFQDDLTWTSSAVPDNQHELLASFAEEIGLDVDDFFKAIDDYQENGILDKMDRDKRAGLKATVTGTPTWFVNSRKLDGSSDSIIRTAIDNALKTTE